VALDRDPAGRHLIAMAKDTPGAGQPVSPPDPAAEPRDGRMPAALSPAAAMREARLAAALRANLRRRKAQARGREDAAIPPGAAAPPAAE